jgi:2-polyprenyl-6-methoxyphenol hydroxylase-like FAD-dependent oxidoreductase
MDYDVIIAGGGPIGLLLACELRLGGVSVLVLEKMPDPNSPLKGSVTGGRGLNIPSIEAFYRRGLLPALSKAALWWVSPSDVRQLGSEASAAFRQQGPTSDAPAVQVPAAAPAKATPTFVGHFAGIMLDANVVNYADPEFAGHGPAAAGGMITMQAIEALLADRATELGAEIKRGTPLTNFEADADGVTVHSDDEVFSAAWLVGCDGGRSTVRKLTGFDFPGTDPEITGYNAMVTIADPEKLSPGWNRTAKGTYVNGPVPGRILTVEFDGPPADREAPITIETLEQSLRNVSGTDVTITAIHTATRWTDNARQASNYRQGRVLLAGDAAHVHSPFGGQGLNLGIGDAVNLGWKLAATIKGWAPESLLDTYTTERHPIGAWALEWTRAQVALMRPERHELALTSVVRDLVGTRDGATYFAKKISGVWQRYDIPGDHPLIGKSAPDFEFEDGSRLGEYCHDGRALLFNFADNQQLRELGAKWSDRLQVVTVSLKESDGPTALFMRPDGCVAWAANGEPNLAAAAIVLSEWLGPSTEIPN